MREKLPSRPVVGGGEALQVLKIFENSAVSQNPSGPGRTHQKMLHSANPSWVVICSQYKHKNEEELTFPHASP